jgi:AcrR family transcriptional regulator
MSTVEQFERTLLLDAMLEEVAEKGYRGAEVGAALRRAGLDGEEWAAEFADKDACLFAAYGQLTERLMDAVMRACAEGGEWPQRVRRGLRALLEELAGRPAVARVLTRTFPAIGPEARGRYEAFVQGLAPLLGEGRELSGMAAELPGEVEMLAVGAAEAIVLNEIEAGRAAGLPDLAAEILFSVLVPFLGPERAAAAMRPASDAEEVKEGGLEAA